MVEIHRFGTLLRKYRKDNDITMMQLAEHTRISRQTIGHIERKLRMPSHLTVATLISRLNLPDDVARFWNIQAAQDNGWKINPNCTHASELRVLLLERKRVYMVKQLPISEGLWRHIVYDKGSTSPETIEKLIAFFKCSDKEADEWRLAGARARGWKI